MTDKEIEVIANKVADILWNRYEERQNEFATMTAEIMFNVPIDDLIISQINIPEETKKHKI